MSKRLKILSMQECFPYPRFTTRGLKEMLDMTAKALEKRAAREGWKRISVQEFEENGEIVQYEMWDAMTMPVKTRVAIAQGHYQIEEDDSSLIYEVEDEVSRLMALFPGANEKVLTAALFRARQFECICDAILSLRIPVDMAFEAIGTVSGTPQSVFEEISSRLDGDEEFSFLTSNDDTRLLMLIQYYSERSGEFLPELGNPQTFSADEGVLQ
jgi:hypothetical protein